MLTLEAAVQAALVSGVVSLTVVLLNARSLRETRGDEHRRRRQDWFLEKQARDAEEIVATFERFSKQFSGHLRQAASLMIDATSILDILERDLSSDELKLQKKRLSDDFRKLGTKVRADRPAVETWFNYDLLRLTVWFDGLLPRDEKFTDLGLKFAKLHVRLSNSSMLNAHITQRPDSSREAAFDKAGQNLEEIQEEWIVLLEDIGQLQRNLIGMLRDTQPQKVAWWRSFRLRSRQ
jgi:hypothetical protein